MTKTVRDVLLYALENLSETSFKKFCNKLMDWEMEAAYNKIPRRYLEKAQPDDVTDLILRYYDVYGQKLTVDVLRAIDDKQAAINLEKDLQRVNDSRREKPTEHQSTQEASSAPVPKAAPVPKTTPVPNATPFVDKHRKELINRCALVAPILDGLLHRKLITLEQNDTILAEKIPQDQMRKLFTCTRGWSDSDKQSFYEILKETNPPLIKNLEQS